MLRSTSPCVFSRLGAIESISSMKMIAGAFFSASSNALRRFDSDSPASLDMISGPLMRKKKAPVSFATALAMSVLPEPGGPYSKIPLGGLTPMVLNSVGWRRGNSTSSRICAICLPHAADVVVPDLVEALLVLPVDRLALAEDLRVGGHDAVLRGVRLHDLELHAAHAAAGQKRVALAHGAVRLEEVRYTSKRFPLTPSIVSLKGRTWIRWPYFTSVH